MVRLLFFSKDSEAVEAPAVIRHRQEGAQTAICLIHGFGGDAEQTWGDFPKYLLADPRLAPWDLYSIGYDTDLSFDVVGVWSASPPLDRLAGLLRTVASHGDLEPYRSLALVAHSMGGLIVQRALVDDPDLVVRVGHVVLFGTPSNGLLKASLLSRWKRQIRDMAEGSPFITDLRDRWAKQFGDTPPFEFISVAGSTDEFVSSESALGPFPGDQQAIVFGNHVEIVKPGSADDLSVQLVVKHLVGGAAPAGPWNSARVAVEMRDFHGAVAQLEGHRDQLDEKHKVYLALALEGVGREADAVDLLEQAKGTDALGVLAGRHKRRWQASGREADGERALELYLEGYSRSAEVDAAQGFYHAINVAFMSFAFRGDLETARGFASLALHHASEVSRTDKWSLATEGEAYLLLGQDETAMVRYHQAVSQAPSPRELESMYRQAKMVAELLEKRDLLERLERIFRHGSTG